MVEYTIVVLRTLPWSCVASRVLALHGGFFVWKAEIVKIHRYDNCIRHGLCPTVIEVIKLVHELDQSECASASCPTYMSAAGTGGSPARSNTHYGRNALFNPRAHSKDADVVLTDPTDVQYDHLGAGPSFQQRSPEKH